jgi:hypothetical protein
MTFQEYIGAERKPFCRRMTFQEYTKKWSLEVVPGNLQTWQPGAVASGTTRVDKSADLTRLKSFRGNDVRLGPQIRRMSHLRKVRKSNKLFKTANLWFSFSCSGW